MKYLINKFEHLLPAFYHEDFKYFSRKLLCIYSIHNILKNHFSLY